VKARDGKSYKALPAMDFSFSNEQIQKMIIARERIGRIAVPY
jgi:hypothetical protein